MKLQKLSNFAPEGLVQYQVNRELTHNNRAVLKAYYSCQRDKDVPSECDYSVWSIEKLLPVACFSEDRLDCPWRPTAYWIEWAILGDTVTKCPSWVLHAQWDPVRVYGIVGMCTIYYLCNRKRQKIGEACHVPCPGQSLTKERGKGSEGGGRTRQMKECRDEKVCLCSVPLGLNWAAGKGAITCVSLTAHSLIAPADS